MTLPTLVVLFLQATLVADGVWLVLFQSDIMIRLANKFWRDPSCESEMTLPSDLSDWLLSRRQWFLHKLWTCRLCQAVWTTGAASVCFAASLPLDTWDRLRAVPVAFLTMLPLAKWTQKHL